MAKIGTFVIRNTAVIFLLVTFQRYGIRGKPQQRELNQPPSDWRDLLTNDVYEYHVNKPSSQSLFESDIAGHERNVGNLHTSNLLQRNAIMDRNLRWSGGVVPYEISVSFTPNENSIIEEALNDIMRKTCIRFVKYEKQADYASFVRRGIGCSSYVARTGGKQLIDLMPGCIYKIGEVQHEVMHALGFYHEQSRTDRDDHVTIIWSNIKEGAEDQFNKYRSDFLDVPYDYESIMHYGWNYFAKDASKPTILPKRKAALGTREVMSRADVEKINRLYECPQRTNAGPSATSTATATTQHHYGHGRHGHNHGRNEPAIIQQIKKIVKPLVKKVKDMLRE